MTARPPVVAMLVPGGLEHAGGIGRWAGYLERSWTAQGLTPALEIIDTRGHGGPARGAAAFAQAIARLVTLRREGRLALIHANLSKRGSTIRKVLIGCLARRLGVPLVVHLHGSGYDAFYDALPTLLRRPVRALLHDADRLIVLGRGWAAFAADRTGRDPARIDTLPNGVPTPTLPPSRGPVPHILFLGRVGPRKGVPELLEALASPALATLPWRATLAGDGELAPYRQFVAARGLSGRVELPGWVDGAAAAALLASADILALPSHAENFPISILEALAACVAVLATPVGATPELLADEVSALFVPVGDAAALSKGLARLLTDGSFRHQIAAAGHAVFRRELEIDSLARRLAAIYAEVLQN